MNFAPLFALSSSRDASLAESVAPPTEGIELPPDSPIGKLSLLISVVADVAPPTAGAPPDFTAPGDEVAPPIAGAPPEQPHAPPHPQLHEHGLAAAGSWSHGFDCVM